MSSILVIMTVLPAVIVCACVFAPVQTSVERATNERLHGIQVHMRSYRKLSDTEREFAVRASSSGFPSSRERAILTLIIASEKKLFPKERLLKLIERNMKSAEGPEAIINAEEYATVLGVQTRVNPARLKEWQLLRSKNKSSKDIDAEEKQLILKMLDSEASSDRMLAARILVEKKQLPARPTQWALRLASKQAQISSERGVRRYWQFVGRAIGVRNGTERIP